MKKLIEIERKFLVINSNFKNESFKEQHIIQGYISTDPERTVRVRIKGQNGFLTIKGIANESGTSRFEWESEISVIDAKALLKMCKLGLIKKTRYNIKYENQFFEVDEFYCDNKGLIIAEIELSSENESIKKPNWLGKEVTGDVKYYNSMIAKNPYKKWKETDNT